MADRVRFELTVRVNGHTLSKRAQSTTLPPVRLCGRFNKTNFCPLGNA